MNTTPGTPDALLWKLAHLAAGVENKACEDMAISLDLKEIAQLLQDIKNALPADNAWSLYLTPAIIWSTVWSLYQNSLELGGYQNRDAMVQLVRDAVQSLQNALQANAKAAGVRSIGTTAALEHGSLAAG
ncbi:hypothetical protein [Acetobacter sp. LMG 32666]|uniref:hypothetical protein n=1 Tax=Acetobacter sp. LMG 32666 TaxID=2959295 RepID=UPI0030C7E7B4